MSDETSAAEPRTRLSTSVTTAMMEGWSAHPWVFKIFLILGYLTGTTPYAFPLAGKRKWLTVILSVSLGLSFSLIGCFGVDPYVRGRQHPTHEAEVGCPEKNAHFAIARKNKSRYRDRVLFLAIVHI